jgi:uncharacterized phage protein gp47/JayE
MPPVEQLPGEIVTPTRDEVIARHKRSFRLRVPGADTGEGTQPHVDATVAADTVMPLHAASVIVGRNTVMEEATGEAVDQWLEREGVPPRRDAVGGSGYVQISTSAGGTAIQAGDELVHEETAFTFRALETRAYTNGQSVSIIAIDTGPNTNLKPGTQLRWSSPRPGCGSIATVVEQASGSGLTGGRERETDDEAKARLRQAKQNRAASGNDAEYQELTEGTPQVAVQKAFTYPGILFPGTTCVAFTMLPAVSGGSRIPNPAQVALAESYVVGEMPADDGAFFALLDEEDADIAYGVTWAQGAVGWKDVAPWPPYYAEDGTPGGVFVSAATSPTSFTLAADDYTGIQQPVAGQTIGLFNADDLEFVQKRILSFTGTGPWVITVDTTNNVSDEEYTPEVGQRAMPWSDSLELLLPGICAYFDALGPGEQVATFYDEGNRQRRQPRPAPRTWPSTLTNKGLLDAIEIDAVEDAEVLEGDGLAPSVGTPGVLANILRLRWIAIFPETV